MVINTTYLWLLFGLFLLVMITPLYNTTYLIQPKYTATGEPFQNRTMNDGNHRQTQTQTQTQTETQEGFSGAADPANRNVHQMMVLGHLPRVRLTNPFNPFIDVETTIPDNHWDNQHTFERVPWGKSHLERLEGFESNSKSGQVSFSSYRKNHSSNSHFIPL
jgi:hypothetical protein